MKVLLLTGYLGSGKTTLLNRILNNRKGIKFAVIVNDIGEVNIDATLIEQGGIVGQGDDSLVALQNGCICCTLKMDLVNQLRDIALMQKFDYVVIEASGICEPEPIAQTICSIPSQIPDFPADALPRLDCIVTMVDALRMRDEFKNGLDLTRPAIDEEDIENLVIQQIEFCNIILLNKASEVKPDELEQIRQIVRALQPKAEIIDCNYGDVDFDRILNTGMFDFDELATSATWVHEVEAGAELSDKSDESDESDHEHHHHEEHDEEEHHHEEHEHEHEHEHHHHHHHDHDEGEAEEYGIGTYVYFNREPFDINKFDDFVARRWPKGIIRAKGICYFYGEGDVCYLFEQAGKQVALKDVGQWFATMPERELQQRLEWDKQLQRDWDPVYGDRMQKLVFIGQHLDKTLLKKELDNCLKYV
ncbi:MAG: GTP-binding protein [Bacteroidales bacterium]|nr:GTP-binding protein [Bacteroidales bacterium]